MSEAPTTPEATAPPNPIGDPMMPDEAVAAVIADAVPGTNVDGQPTILGEHVYSAVLVAIRRERNRVERVINEIAADLMQKSRSASGEAQLAKVQGNERAARELEGRAAANGGIATYLARFLVLAVGLPPGECRACLGRKMVPSRLAVGSAQFVPCPACSAPKPSTNGIATS